MTNYRSYIKPMMIEINQTIKDTIYYLSLPKVIKEKWIELERKSRATYNPKYYLPTKTLEEQLCTFLNGVINMNPVSETTDDTKWLVSFKNINVNIVVNCFKIWVQEFYINGALNWDYKRKNGEDDSVRKLANELLALLTIENFDRTITEEITLFHEGKAIDKVSFKLYPLRLVNESMGKSIMFNGIETKLLYSSSNELTTDTKDFHHKNDYFSYVIKLSVQTLPPENKAYLVVDVSTRRWISKNEKGKVPYLPNNKNCYIRVSNNRLQVMQTEYDKNRKENVWRSVDFAVFKESHPFNDIPSFTDVLTQPENFNFGKIGDVLIPYEEGLNGINTSVDSGVAFVDRDTAFNFILDQVHLLDQINSNVQAFHVKKIAQNTKIDFESKSDGGINSTVFMEQLEKALHGEKLTIEIYAKGEMRKSLLNQLHKYFKDNTKHEIVCCDDVFINELQKTEMSKKENIPGFEKRVAEITRRLAFVTTPTLAIIAIHDEQNYKKSDYSINVDPKDAIRAGFATTGRLTQFITFEKFENEVQRIRESDEKYEIKKRRAEENGQKLQARSKTDRINQAVNGAILDGFRQLGVVFNYEKNKHLRGKKIVGVHVCNFKKTKYGTIPPFPIIVTYDVDRSQIMVYSDLIDKVDVPYWKGILTLSKLAAERDILNIRKSISSTTVYRRLERIINKDDKDVLIIFDANRPTRNLIKGISNSKIAEAEKNEFNQIEKMLITEDRLIDFSEVEKQVSVVRIRRNDEVSSYIPMTNESDQNKYKQVSGIYKYEHVYYSIDGRPQHESKVYNKETSKSNSPKSFSHRNMVELYPIYVSGNNETQEKNEIIAIGVVDLLRKASIQFTAQKTVLPLPLHLAMKMEEYIT
jgi:pPIWI_RE module N-terminal domain/RNaseH domain of pPIWI_RE/MID domain of pPIWI_RE